MDCHSELDHASVSHYSCVTGLDQWKTGHFAAKENVFFVSTNPPPFASLVRFVIALPFLNTYSSSRRCWKTKRLCECMCALIRKMKRNTFCKDRAQRSETMPAISQRKITGESARTWIWTARPLERARAVVGIPSESGNRKSWEPPWRQTNRRRGRFSNESNFTIPHFLGGREDVLKLDEERCQGRHTQGNGKPLFGVV